MSKPKCEVLEVNGRCRAPAVAMVQTPHSEWHWQCDQHLDATLHDTCEVQMLPQKDEA